MSWREALDRARRTGGRRYWRSLGELLDRPDFRRALADEFPALATEPLDWERRDILRCLGAALALSGLAGCEARPDEQAMPYVRQPEDLVPGRMRGYATAFTFAGYAQPVIGMTNVGRPTKIEGNPDHPASRGTTDAFTQASLLDLYDPDRATGILQGDRPTSWEEFDRLLAAHSALHDATQGQGFALLSGAVSSPTLLRQIAALQARWPKARWYADEVDLRDGRAPATRVAFGRSLDRLPLLDAAHATVVFDDDPLGPGPGMTWNSLGWSQRRRAFQKGDGASALFVAEPSPTLTGGRADGRLMASPSRIPALVAALAAIFGLPDVERPVLLRPERQWIEAAAKALAAAKGRGLVLVGGGQPPEIQALGLAIDERLGNLTVTSRFVEPVRATPAGDGSLDALVAEMTAGEISTLLVLDANPVQMPGQASFASALSKVELSIHAGLHRDETARMCRWHVPLAHDYESWSDGRAVDGSPIIVQPLVRPFFGVRGRHALLAGLLGAPGTDDRAIVRETWRGLTDEAWRQALVTGSAGPAATAVTPGAVRRGALPPPAQAGGLELLVRPDPTLWDGRFANNPWNQERPKPFTTLTWDNAVHIAPALAVTRGLETGDVVRLSRGGGWLEGPVFVLPGQAPEVVLLHLGSGRRTGAVADGVGFDALTPIGMGPLTIERTGARRLLALTQQHHAIDGRDLVRETHANDRQGSRPAHVEPSFYEPGSRTKPNWGMSIDLDLCTGCGACVSACIAENNIPMVGREQVAKGREMHWLRVDQYQEGPAETPRFHNQPVPCMHCENAPCEMGCPVNASVHSPEGLNLQVYNRCIGTRTCSSYCPYKVRRFNWYDFTSDAAESVQAQRNPNVTVRARGVMEKCTYCIQRLSSARIDAKLAGRAIRDGDVKTACQQVCPTGAISFGDITDEAAEVVRRKRSPRDYTLLPEANTRPRTSYLARIRRPEDDA